MAPKAAAARGSKRPAKRNDTAQKGEAAKKPKTDPVAEAVCGVIADADLPVGCKDMLLACAPLLFASYAGERHEVQERVYGMVGEVMQQAKAALEQKRDEARNGTLELEGASNSLRMRVAEAQARSEAAAAAVEARKADIDRIQGTLASKSEELASAQQAQRAGDACARRLGADAAALGKARDVGLPAIKDDTSDASKRAAGLDTLQPLWALLELDSSLVTALPSVCAKMPSERGAFDKKVLEVVEEFINNKAREFAVKLEETVPAVVERAAVVEAAKGAVEAATQQQRAAEVEADAARLKLEEEKTCVTHAKEVEAGREPALQVARQVEAAAEVELQQFIDQTFACFASMREQERAQPMLTTTATEEAPHEIVAEALEGLKPEAALAGAPADISAGGA